MNENQQGTIERTAEPGTGTDSASQQPDRRASGVIARLLQNLSLGAPRQFRNMVVFPVFHAVNHSPDYLTLSEALQTQLLTMTEISQGGHVPCLKAHNQADRLVLLLDGEELIGAK